MKTFKHTKEYFNKNLKVQKQTKNKFGEYN